MITNEERRCPVYFAQINTPTIPSEVTMDTLLEDLNLNWREKDLPERERTKHIHRLQLKFVGTYSENSKIYKYL
jgi:hypothetical protein